MEKVIYPVIAAVNFNGKLVILTEDTGNGSVESAALSEVLDYEIEFDIPENARPEDWDFGNVYKLDIIVTYSKHWTDCGYEYDSEIDVDNFKLIHAYNKL